MKKSFIFAMGIALAAFNFQSCSTEIGGATEDYHIEDIAKGELNTAEEPYTEAAATFDVTNEQDIMIDGNKIGSLDFYPNGTLVITPKESVPSHTRGVRAEAKVYGSYSYTYDKATNVYTATVDGHSIVVDANKLTVKVDATQAGVEKVQDVDSSAVTKRLSHVWNLESGIVNFYKKGKFIGPYTLKGEKLKEYGFEQIAFTRTGRVTRYNSGSKADLGKWQWVNPTKQVLHYIIPDKFEGDANIYFDGNDIYVEQNIDINFAEDTGIKIDGKTLEQIGLDNLEAKCIFKGKLATSLTF